MISLYPSAAFLVALPAGDRQVCSFPSIQVGMAAFALHVKRVDEGDPIIRGCRGLVAIGTWLTVFREIGPEFIVIVVAAAAGDFRLVILMRKRDRRPSVGLQRIGFEFDNGFLGKTGGCQHPDDQNHPQQRSTFHVEVPFAGDIFFGISRTAHGNVISG
jgi:hypothetical protein